MKRFRFALQRVRRLRTHQGRAARLAMASELAVLNALEAGLMRTRQRVCGEIELAERRVESARDAYRTQRRDLPALDKLRDKAWQTWNEEWRAEEQGEFDEMARPRFAAQARAGQR